MKGTQQLLIATVAALVVAAIGTHTASADTEGTIRIESASGLVGDTVAVDIISDVEPPGLGAWTVDLTYDADVLSMVLCRPYQGGVCSTEFGDGVGRVTGAITDGLVGDAPLVTFYFECGSEPGTSRLELSLEVFADVANPPQSIDEDVIDGEITCADRQAMLELDSATMAIGETRRVAITGSNLPVDPGLGSWSILVHYDASRVRVARCEVGGLMPDDPGVNTCRNQVDTGSIFIQGASANGLDAEHTFAEFDVSCHSEGESPLSATVSVWAIPTVGLVDIPLPEIANGSIRCTEATQPAPPPTGSGPASPSTLWPLIALAAFGAIATSAAITLRRNPPSRVGKGARGMGK